MQGPSRDANSFRYYNRDQESGGWDRSDAVRTQGQTRCAMPDPSRRPMTRLGHPLPFFRQLAKQSIPPFHGLIQANGRRAAHGSSQVAGQIGNRHGIVSVPFALWLQHDGRLGGLPFG